MIAGSFFCCFAEGSVDELRMICPYRYRAEYSVDVMGSVVASSISEAQAQLQALGVSEYSIAKTSLEDIYLHMTGRSLGGES
jgi:hypothetical protein